MSIIAFAGQKGGSGKTTTSISVASELFERGHKVLLVDADPQGSAQTWAAVAAELGHAAPVVVGMGAGLHRPDQLPSLAAAPAAGRGVTAYDRGAAADEVRALVDEIIKLALAKEGEVHVAA